MDIAPSTRAGGRRWFVHFSAASAAEGLDTIARRFELVPGAAVMHSPPSGAEGVYGSAEVVLEERGARRSAAEAMTPIEAVVEAVGRWGPTAFARRRGTRTFLVGFWRWVEHYFDPSVRRRRRVVVRAGERRVECLMGRGRSWAEAFAAAAAVEEPRR